MRAKLAGAALAAAIALTCTVASAELAEAAPFTIQVDGPTGADGGVGFVLTGDTRRPTADFNFGELEQAPNYLDYLSTSFDDPNARYRISNVSEVTDEFGIVTRFADFFVSDPNFSFIVTSTDFFGTGQAPQTIRGYSLSFSVQVPYDTTTGTYFEGQGEASTLLIPPASVLQFGQAFATGSPFVSTVPLPAALPMMAFGLFGLGAIGYLSRRRVAAYSAI